MEIYLNDGCEWIVDIEQFFDINHDKLDKELEQSGLRFTGDADDVLIFSKSEMAANRGRKFICSWLERKLFLKVNVIKNESGQTDKK